MWSTVLTPRVFLMIFAVLQNTLFLLPTQAATYKNKKKLFLLMRIAAVEANGEWEVISLSRNFI